MRIIHCADLHLDSKMTTNLPPDKAKERGNEILSTYMNMINYARENEVSHIIIAGDLFDSVNISKTAFDTVNYSITDNPDICFYYLAGNHEKTAFVDKLASIPDNLVVLTEAYAEYELSGMVKIISGIGDMELDEDSFNIVVMHGQIADYEGESVIGLNTLEGRNIDYLAMGHIHSYSQEAIDARGIYCYSGCLEGRGFDECGNHGFVLLEVDEQMGRLISAELIPIARRTFHKVEVEISECMSTNEIAAAITSQLEEDYYDPEDMLKIILTGDVSENCNKDLALLNKLFEDKFYLLKISDESRIAIDYSKYELDASLRGEFVRLIRDDDTLTRDEKNGAILYGLKVLSGEDIL